MDNITDRYIAPRTYMGESFYEYRECGFYEDSSVLAGQSFDRVADHYDTLEEAIEANPGVRVESSESNPIPRDNALHWLPGEDDMVPGGALPDDIDDGI